MTRYPALFERLAAAGEGAFVPFVMLGDPTPDVSLQVIEALIAGGADALELGIPFTDPVADGPTIQDAHLRALDAGVGLEDAFDLVATIRQRHPDLPIGLLIYGNVAFARGIDNFYDMVAASGADSVLIPDLPVREGAPFKKAANERGIDQIFIAPPSASEETIRNVAGFSTGYIYAVSRLGVTGTEHASETQGLTDIVGYLKKFDGAPALLGFGISTPEHVKAAIDAGAKGAISGSAITKIIAAHVTGEHPEPREVPDPDALTAQLRQFVADMKQATR